jgi:uncharacterized hydrophobic protein (TIGR00341 family)
MQINKSVFLSTTACDKLNSKIAGCRTRSRDYYSGSINFLADCVKYLIVTAPEGYRDTVSAALENADVKEAWWENTPSGSDTFTVRLICSTSNESGVLNSLQKCLAGTDKGSIHSLNVDATYPNPEPLFVTPQLSREELYKIADNGARSDSSFLLLVGLSTIVAAIGLIQNNVAVIIGAMVIAPLLGPNLSIALGASLGETAIIRRAAGALVKGCLLSLLVGYVVGLLWQDFVINHEIQSRTSVGLDSALLAVASGVAAVLSMTSGASAALVGVMVAVALVPPLATTGLLLGHGNTAGAIGSALLLIVNIAAINFAAHVTLFFANVTPRVTKAAGESRKRNLIYALFWLILLMLTNTAAYWHSGGLAFR